MHTYGLSFDTKWITVHDTVTDGTTVFNANRLARDKLATPFKRPENGQFRPGTNFGEFVFDETGDTDLLTQAGTKYGGFGAIFRQVMTADTRKISLVYNSDSAHSGFDNCAFWDRNRIVFVEDAGDTLHQQRQALDSAWLFDLNTDYSAPPTNPSVSWRTSGIAIGEAPAGDFVVTFIDETRGTKQLGINGCGNVASLRGGCLKPKFVNLLKMDGVCSTHNSTATTSSSKGTATVKTKIKTKIK